MHFCRTGDLTDNVPLFKMNLTLMINSFADSGFWVSDHNHVCYTHISLSKNTLYSHHDMLLMNSKTTFVLLNNFGTGFFIIRTELWGLPRFHVQMSLVIENLLDTCLCKNTVTQFASTHNSCLETWTIRSPCYSDVLT